uniref:TIGR02757 family protein n=2 Tax=environmental samples TaxID=48479 RepID=A0A806K1Q4_9BACT|nr:hypothetical protein [uncultured bacterium contig00054]
MKQELDSWYRKVCKADFILHDPVQFPHRYKKREDVEIAAFLAATIAWGRRDLILRSAEKMFALMGKSPYDFVISGEYKKLRDKNIHRTFFESDLKYFCRGFEYCYKQYGNLEKLFTSVPDVWQGILLFRKEMARGNKGAYSKHISNPGEPDRGGSACKRLNLALRWLVRGEPVDLHLWRGIKPAALYIPLDVHVARTARKLKLLKRKSNDKGAVIELTEKLREFCKEDPIKYDFALFGLGISSSKS